MTAALLALIAVLLVLRWRAERRHRALARRRWELIAGHIQRQERPRLRLVKGGRER